jgi:hypothetical protein
LGLGREAKGTPLGQGLNSRVIAFLLMLVTTLALAACSGSSQNSSTQVAEVDTSTPVAPLTPRPLATPPPPPSSILALPTVTGTAAAVGTPLSPQQLSQLALTVTDLPPGFAATGSGQGGPELGPDVLASWQQEFQQRDVTSTQALQQTIVIIDLLGQYKTPASALSGIRAVNAQSLNQLLGSVNLTAEAASVPAIEEDSAAFHFLGDTNGTSVGGYLIVFHRGPIASLILTASVKGSESLAQTVDLAQKQAQRVRGAG